MSRTPLHNRALTDSKERAPLGGRVIKDKTPLGNKVIKDKTPLDNHPKDESIDQRLLDVLRSLNLAVAAVAQARDRRFINPDAKLSPDIAVHALMHLKDAAQQLDVLRRGLAKD